MSFLPGLGWGDLVNLATTAWKAYEAIQGAPDAFRDISSEFGGLTICMQSMKENDIAEAIALYAQSDVHRQKRLGLLVKNLSSAIVPMDKLVKKAKKHFGLKSGKFNNLFQAGKFAWNVSDIQDVRNKLMVHTGSLNIFLTRLTHFTVHNMSKNMQVPASTVSGAQNRARASSPRRRAHPQYDDGLEGVWSSIGRSLVTGKHGKREVMQGVQHFQEEIRQFALFLLDRGRPPRPATITTRKRQYEEIHETTDSAIPEIRSRLYAERESRRARSYVERRKRESEETYEATERGNGEGLQSLFRSIGRTDNQAGDSDDDEDDDEEDGSDSDDSTASEIRNRPPPRRYSPEEDEDEIVVVGGPSRHTALVRPGGHRRQSSPGPYTEYTRPHYDPLVVTITPSRSRPSPPTSPQEVSEGMSLGRQASNGDNGLFVLRKKVKKSPNGGLR